MTARRSRAVGWGVAAAGFVCVTFLAWRSLRPASTPVDTAPVDLRGKPIRATSMASTAGGPTSATLAGTGAATSVATLPAAAGSALPPSAGTDAGAPASPTPTAPATFPVDEAGYLQVGFDTLASFTYAMPPSPLPPDYNLESERGKVPATIRSLDQQRVSVRGFMLPLKIENGLVKELLIMRDQSMCCFGVVPQLNEWVSVKMSGAGVRAVMDQPVTLHGRLQVREVIENNYLVGLYAMDGDHLTTSLDE